MKHQALIALLLLFSSVGLASSDKFIPGDRVFIQARVIGCGDTIWNVEVGKVEDSGEAVLFQDISLHAEGKSTKEVAEIVTDEVERKYGHRPTSISVVRVPKEAEKQASLMMMEIAQLRSNGCRSNTPPTEVPDWQQNLQFIAMAPHNKSLNTDAHFVGAG